MDWVIIASDSSLAVKQLQAITGTNHGMLLIGLVGTGFIQCNLNQNTTIFIQGNAYENIVCKIGSGFNVLKTLPEMINSSRFIG